LLAPAVLLLGHRDLRRRSEAVGRTRDAELPAQIERLHAVLRAFRAEHGFGRAIAAPQIGIHRRVIALDLGAGPFTVVDPVIRARSVETVTLWDDCMSFPDLLVRVRRHASISLDYREPGGRQVAWDCLEPDLAELLQHEIDHLDGVLAVDHALDRDALVLRSVFEERFDELAKLVDLPPRRPARPGIRAAGGGRGDPRALRRRPGS
jgi:peptide deformylase